MAQKLVNHQATTGIPTRSLTLASKALIPLLHHPNPMALLSRAVAAQSLHAPSPWGDGPQRVTRGLVTAELLTAAMPPALPRYRMGC